MTHANIIALIDLQNGFTRSDIPQNQGGCLYVPGGENAPALAAELMLRAKNTIFILSQDFHPQNHIAFMENHKGVMELRRAQLSDKYEGKDLEAAILDPRLLPFTDILVKKGPHRYVPIGCKVEGEWRKVDTNYDEQIVHISRDILPVSQRAGAFEQKLWRKHCIQGSKSAQFDMPILGALPGRLRSRLKVDTDSPVLKERDENGNIFIIVRKGMRTDLDSYGIATENDNISQTQAPVVFVEIAEALKKQGVTHADIDIGGLATNFCTELSEIDIHKHLVPVLKSAGITSRIHFLSDISFGIPVSTPDGSWPDLANAEARMAARGTHICTVYDALRSSLKSSLGPVSRYYPSFLKVLGLH